MSLFYFLSIYLNYIGSPVKSINLNSDLICMINIMFISYICIHFYTELGEKSGIRAKINAEKNITILVCHTRPSMKNCLFAVPRPTHHFTPPPTQNILLQSLTCFFFFGISYFNSVKNYISFIQILQSSH